MYSVTRHIRYILRRRLGRADYAPFGSLQPRLSWLRQLAAVCLLAAAPAAHARMGLIVAEPFGSFGTMMPQGHTSIYFSDLCVETPVKLRPCHAGERGAVISRYHDLRHPDLDWMAFPLPVFLYGVPDVADLDLPFATADHEREMRESYWHDHLAEYIPARVDRHGRTRPPAYGDWEEGIGAAYDRRLLMYVFDTTAAQDAVMLNWVNERPNQRRYTLTRHNCADFAADLLRIALPPASIHRNVPADFDMTTPKNLARQVDAYGKTHPELHLSVYEIPQLPGELRRSRPIRGAAESLLTTKRYMATLLLIQPEMILAAWIDYEKRGKWTLGQDAVAIRPDFWGAATEQKTLTAEGLPQAKSPAASELPPPDAETPMVPSSAAKAGADHYSAGSVGSATSSTGFRAK